jgi:hypothetical protein
MTGPKKRPRDLNQLAASIVASATAEEPEAEPCPECGGSKVVKLDDWRDGEIAGQIEIGCAACRGTGKRQEDQAEESAAAKLGRVGGLRGGKARAAKLSAERRREIALKAANARWKKANEPTGDDQQSSR